MGNREYTDSFEDLDVWQHSLRLSVNIYKITRSFPKDELYGLTSQMRRAANSISANIAEGYGRRNKAEKAQFYKVAYGSLLEVKSFIYLSEKLSFIDEAGTKDILSGIVTIQKELNALIRSMASNV